MMIATLATGIGPTKAGEASGPPANNNQPATHTQLALAQVPPVLVASAPMDDAEIAERLRTGDRRAAIGACARSIGPALTRLCFVLLCAQAEADEAAQETLLAAYDSAGSFRGEGTVRAWLFGIARRICARRLEVRTRQARRKPLMVGDGAEVVSAEVLLDDARRGAEVRAALMDLRPTEREAVLLRYEGEMSCREVGDACGIDEAAARKRIGRALSRLRERLVK